MKRSKKAWAILEGEQGEVLRGWWTSDDAFALFGSRAGALRRKWPGERVVPCVITWHDGKPAPRKRGAKR